MTTTNNEGDSYVGWISIFALIARAMDTLGWVHNIFQLLTLRECQAPRVAEVRFRKSRQWPAMAVSSCELLRAAVSGRQCAAVAASHKPHCEIVTFP